MVATVLVFAGLDPSGGAGLAADIAAIAAMGAHALPVATALTVQDNERVFDVAPVDTALVVRQAEALIGRVAIDAVKIGIPGNRANAIAIAALAGRLRVPVVLDPVLASGHGDGLSPLAALEVLLPLASLITPNVPEAALLAGFAASAGAAQGAALRARCRGDVLITGGHALLRDDNQVVNRWYGPGIARTWHWPRLPGQFHGSGCTLAAAVAARLACGDAMAAALDSAQRYTHEALAESFSIAGGQRIPARCRAHQRSELEQFI